MMRLRSLAFFPAFALLGSALGALACSLDATGGSGGPDLGGSATATSSNDDSGSSEGSSTSSSGGDPSTSTTEPGESSSSSEGIVTPALLEFSLDDDALRYGAIPVGKGVTQTVVLENRGGSPATTIESLPIPGAFSFPGGFPGTDGTCGSSLDPGSSCTVVIRFAPSIVGRTQSTVSIAYYDGINLGMPTTTAPLVVMGGGGGETENLLVNGGAEDGGIEPWDPGIAVWDVDNTAFVGDFAFYPSGGAFVQTSLFQQISMVTWAEPAALGGLRYEFSSRGRSFDTDHQYSMFVSFNDDEGTPILQGNSENWEEGYGAGEVPTNAKTAMVRLTCTRVGSGPCDVRFDAIDFRLAYP